MSQERAERLWDVFLHSLWPLLQGMLKYTIPLSILSFGLSLIFALLIALAGLSHLPYLRMPSRFYVWIIRGTPILVQLFIIFYGLPSFGIILPAFPTVVIALTVSEAAYCSEIMRSTIKSLPQGQWKAGYSLGMTPFQVLRRVILPQAARISIPPLGSQFISLFKTSSLAALVTLPDLFGVAKQIAASTFEPMLLYIVAAGYYLAICSVLTIFQHRLENKFGKYSL
jgi:cystine transport system permease protein